MKLRRNRAANVALAVEVGASLQAHVPAADENWNALRHLQFAFVSEPFDLPGFLFATQRLHTLGVPKEQYDDALAAAATPDRLERTRRALEHAGPVPGTPGMVIQSRCGHTAEEHAP